jgi:hypothetical protein
VLLADALRESWKGRDVCSGYHFLIDIAGVIIDIAHHGPHPGSRSWLRGNVARFYLRDLMFQHLLHGEKPPDLVARSHFHSFVNEVVTEGEYESRLIVTPPLCVPGDHARKATRSIGQVTCGIVLVECVDGRIGQVAPVMDTLDIRKHEVV